MVGTPTPHATEEEHHDEFYRCDASAVFDTPWFLEVRRVLANLLMRRGRGSPQDRVLSLGCGDGRVECLMASHVQEIVGIDVSSVAIDQARARAAHGGLANLRFEVGDIERLALPPASFDVIWMLGVLHHLDQPGTIKLLGRCLEILQPGGVMVSNDPSARRLIRVFKAFVRMQYRKYHSPDERELDPHWLAKTYAAVGFNPVSICYNDFFLGPLAWLSPRGGSLVKPLSALDSLLLAVPGVRTLASDFLVIARKP